MTVSIGAAHSNGVKFSGLELVANANKALGAAQKKHNTVLLFRPDNLNMEADTLTAEEYGSLSTAVTHLH